MLVALLAALAFSQHAGTDPLEVENGSLEHEHALEAPTPAELERAAREARERLEQAEARLGDLEVAVEERDAALEAVRSQSARLLELLELDDLVEPVLEAEPDTGDDDPLDEVDLEVDAEPDSEAP
jgi:TolA-binding protein